jgi:hypothetical protein
MNLDSKRDGSEQQSKEEFERRASTPDLNEDALEFERLSNIAHGDSRGWKFNREEIHERS